MNLIDKAEENSIYMYIYNVEGTVSTDPIVLILPAEPNAKWYLLSGLNLTQQTFALASRQAIEFSALIDQSFTEIKWLILVQLITYKKIILLIIMCTSCNNEIHW